jgi:peptidoglycan/LPS O-acetylase OafA/YrhL
MSTSGLTTSPPLGDDRPVAGGELLKMDNSHRPARELLTGTYFPTLDGWRAIAIVGVLLAHGMSATWAKRGTIGVKIFFGISGFLICSRLIEEARRSGRISLAGFYIRRTFRILPPYLAYLAALAVLSALGVIAVARWEFVTCLLFVRNYVPHVVSTAHSLDGWYTGHFWSLAVEEHFYLILPSLLILLGMRRARWSVAVIAIAFAAWRMIEWRLQLYQRVFPAPAFYLRTDMNLDGLFWGCWVALLLSDPIWRERFVRWLSPAISGVLLAVFIVSVALSPPFHIPFESFVIPLLLVGTVLHPQTLVGRLLESPPMRWIGRLSYSIYLWQQLFMLDPEARGHSGIAVIQSLPWNLACTLACAVVSFYVIERPLIRWGHRLSARREPKRAPSGEIAPPIGVAFGAPSAV